MTKKLIKNKFQLLFKKVKQIKVKDLPDHPEVRGLLFSLEAILRLHLRGDAFSSKKNQILNKALVRLKDLEDALGLYSYAYEIKNYMQQKTNQEPKCLKTNIKISKNIFKKKYKHQIKQLKKSYQELQELNWPEAPTFIPKALNLEIQRIKTKNDTKLKPLILKSKYSDYEIQEGLHEWRRMLRWISIYFQAYKDLFYLSPQTTASAQAKNLINLYKSDAFCILGNKSAPIKVSSLAFYQLSDFIKRVGDLKSEAEIVKTLSEFKLKIPQSFKETKAHKLYQEYEKSDVLNQLKIKENNYAVPKKSR